MSFQQELGARVRRIGWRLFDGTVEIVTALIRPAALFSGPLLLGAMVIAVFAAGNMEAFGFPAGFILIIWLEIKAYRWYRDRRRVRHRQQVTVHTSPGRVPA